LTGAALPESLPEPFLRNLETAFGKEGRRFVRELPARLAEAAERWELELGPPFELSYNYVCQARRADGSGAVLKVGVPCPEFGSEIGALRAYAGRGACRLLEADAGAGILLEELARPGQPLTLVAEADDDEAAGIAADLARELAGPLPDSFAPIDLRAWFAPLRESLGGGPGPYPPRLADAVLGLLAELFAEPARPSFLHGDFHHANILRSGERWIAIDPKGVAGPPEYEIGPFLINPLGPVPGRGEALRRTRRRAAIFAERTGLDERLLLAWGPCHALLGSWWDGGPASPGGAQTLAWAELLLDAALEGGS
jgi:streptomycin 6-kinase